MKNFVIGYFDQEKEYQLVKFQAKNVSDLRSTFREWITEKYDVFIPLEFDIYEKID